MKSNPQEVQEELLVYTTFNGTGSVNYVRLLDENKALVYEDNFNKKTEGLTPTEFN